VSYENYNENDRGDAAAEVDELEPRKGNPASRGFDPPQLPHAVAIAASPSYLDFWRPLRLSLAIAEVILWSVGT
jgi:hypothetical protein